jgi:hypothetical protein
MKRMVTLPIVVSITILFAGCAPYRIVNGGETETFYSDTAALDRLKEIYSQILNGIKLTDDPIHGTVMILIPSDDEILKNRIRFSQDRSKISSEMVEWVVKSESEHLQFLADAIKKRGLFDSVSTNRHNGNPTSLPIGGFDFQLFFDVDGCFIRSKRVTKPLTIPIIVSTPIKEATQKFLDDLSRGARILRNKEAKASSFNDQLGK